MADLTELRVVALTADGAILARRVAAELNGRSAGLKGRTEGCDQTFTDTAAWLKEQFSENRPIVAVMAAGAVIRILAPLLTDKHMEPPVVVVAQDGSAVVPLLGGHRGANMLACQVASMLDVEPAITTAGDVKHGLALDEPPKGLSLTNPQNAKNVMAEIANGRAVSVEGNSAHLAHEWLSGGTLPVKPNAVSKLLFTDQAMEPGHLDLIYNTHILVVGMGCERGCSLDELRELFHETLSANGLAVESVGAIATIDLKADEGALNALADELEIPLRFFDADALEALTRRLANPSELVFREVGCHGVAEGAALAMAGEDALLAVEKVKSKRATMAIARSREIINPLSGRSRGRLFVVGIGPGQDAWRSPEVSRMVGEATDLVGYSLYLDLLGSLCRGKQRHDYALGEEEARVRYAMELAGKGKDVALVCSGDAGIYAMATLVFELLDKGGLSDAASRIGVQVSPGISALQAAAARAGAPLGHDFCTISLSDLLTPWQAIKMRVKAAAQGDFVIAFYNPVSKRRRTQLAHARAVLLEHRPPDTPVILASNLGREEEKIRILPLQDLEVDMVDMLTVVIVGSSDSRVVATGDGRQWVYTPRGYAAKEGTGLSAMDAAQ